MQSAGIARKGYKFMDWNNGGNFPPFGNEEFGGRNRVPQDPMAPLEGAALICGTIGLLTLFFGMGVVFAAMAIMFALLSRREKLARRAKTGLVLGLITLGIYGAALGVVAVTFTTTGMWDVVTEELENMDPSDPEATAKLQDTIQSELLKRLGASGTADTAETEGTV